MFLNVDEANLHLPEYNKNIHGIADGIFNSNSDAVDDGKNVSKQKAKYRYTIRQYCFILTGTGRFKNTNTNRQCSVYEGDDTTVFICYYGKQKCKPQTPGSNQTFERNYCFTKKGNCRYESRINKDGKINQFRCRPVKISFNRRMV